MARKTSSDDNTGQTVDETPTARTADTGDSAAQEQSALVDEGMRHETHGELPSERPPSDF